MSWSRRFSTSTDPRRGCSSAPGGTRAAGGRARPRHRPGRPERSRSSPRPTPCAAGCPSFPATSRFRSRSSASGICSHGQLACELRIELAIRYQCHEVTRGRGRTDRRRRTARTPGANAGIEVDVTDVERRRLVGAVAEHDERPSRVDHRDESAERIASHRLQDEVEPAAELRNVGHDFVGSELTKSRRPRRAAADQRCHLRAAQMRELDRKAADSARCAGHENSATKDGGPEPENPQRGQAGRWKRRRLGEGDAIGQLGDPVCGDRHPLGPGPALPDADDPGAGPRAMLDVGLEDAGEVPARAPAVGGAPEQS